MSVRTTAANIKKIIKTQDSIIVNDADLDPFITVANELVTEMCTGDNGPATEYSATRLELIERWLSAHFYTNRDPRAVSEGVTGALGVNATFQSKVDLGFDTSHYGQTAMRLDTNGGLSKLNTDTKEGGSVVTTIGWLGTKTKTG